MRATEEDLFDAKLRALLSEPTRAAPRRGGHSGLVHGVIVVAAASVLVALWAISTWEGDAAESSPAIASRQDPQPAPNVREFNTWVLELGEPHKRAAAIDNLAGGGRLAAAFLADWLSAQDPEQLDGSADAALQAIARIGANAVVEIPTLQQLIDSWSAVRCVELLQTLGTLAAWRETRVEQRGMSARSLDLNGVEKPIPDPATATRLLWVSQRLAERAVVGADHSAAAMKTFLNGSAFQREAALDVLLSKAGLPPEFAPLVERILIEDQPPIRLGAWDRNGKLGERDSTITPMLRGKAAALLTRKAISGPAASAHVWHLQQSALDALTRRRAALALGHILSREEHKTQPRYDAAVQALLVAVKDLDRAVACDAVTALGQIGADTAPVVAALLALRQHDDTSLAQRAAAALAAIQSASNDKKDK